MVPEILKRVVGVVFAGGEGKRLRPLTYYFQKCMIPIGHSQKPLLEYILIQLMKHNVKDYRFLVGYKHEQIENYFNNGTRFGVNIEYFLDDPTLLGSGGALLNAARNGAFADDDILLLYYGDILSNIDLSAMVMQHVESKSVATLAVTKGYEVSVGVAKIDGVTVVDWEEKPSLPLFAGIGIVVLSTRVIGELEKLVSEHENVDLMGNLIPFLLSRGEKVEAFLTDAFWYDVGSTEKYEKLENGLLDDLFDV